MNEQGKIRFEVRFSEEETQKMLQDIRSGKIELDDFGDWMREETDKVILKRILEATKKLKSDVVSVKDD